MAKPRKIFRIEQTASARLEQSVETTQSGLRHAEIMAELGALRAVLAAILRPTTGANSKPQGGDVARLASELNLIAGAIGGHEQADRKGSRAASAVAAPIPRIAHELMAVVNGTERATQKILAAAEEIDSAANNLSAALDGKIEQGLAQDIRDVVIQIFEACNFQDLIGQRVAKVMATVKFIEDHIARVLEEINNPSAGTRRNDAQFLHGPRLEDDHGHASQGDIDAMFASRR
jgi:chemotaxis protein CheZ